MPDTVQVIDRVETESYGVFRVNPITRGTNLEDVLGLDLITIPSETTTEIHRHVHAENVVYVLSGEATVILDHVEYPVSEGDRIRIGKAVYHGFRTRAKPLVFVSVQAPPILNKKRNILDTEVLEKS